MIKTGYVVCTHLQTTHTSREICYMNEPPPKKKSARPRVRVWTLHMESIAWSVSVSALSLRTLRRRVPAECPVRADRGRGRVCGVWALCDVGRLGGYGRGVYLCVEYCLYSTGLRQGSVRVRRHTQQLCSVLVSVLHVSLSVSVCHSVWMETLCVCVCVCRSHTHTRVSLNTDL